MNLFSENDIEYPLTVTVTRPKDTFGDGGDYVESFDTVVDNLTADIQLSIKVRKLTSEDGTGVTDNAVWIMYCRPAAPIRPGDRVYDGSRTFIVDAVGEWGSHTECVMRIRDEG